MQKVGYDVAVKSMLICILDHTAAFDYVPLSLEIQFNNSLARQCLDITVINDTILEFNESFFVNLDTSDSNVSIENQTATVLIENDDSK